MLKKRVLIVFILFLTFSSSAGARVYLDISAPTLIQIPIVLPKWKNVDKTPATLSEKAYEILAKDLTLSGFFRVIDYHHLPLHLQGNEGIPEMLFLNEWT